MLPFDFMPTSKATPPISQAQAYTQKVHLVRTPAIQRFTACRTSSFFSATSSSLDFTFLMLSFFVALCRTVRAAGSHSSPRMLVRREGSAGCLASLSLSHITVKQSHTIEKITEQATIMKQVHNVIDSFGDRTTGQFSPLWTQPRQNARTQEPRHKRLYCSWYPAAHPTYCQSV